MSRQVSQCEAEKSQLESELQNSEQRKAELQQTINSAKSQKAQCESELSVQKNRCNKMKDKLERLNATYSRVEADLNSYVAATKKFEGNASERTRDNSSAIDRCIESIEQYLSANVGIGSHYGNRTQEQLMDNINSQNSEWKEPHNRVCGASNLNCPELPDSENHFCGLPIERMANGSWGVISACHEAYDVYSRNDDDYTYENFDAFEIRTINAREIAGIDMISDREINNPQSFWGRSGGTYESFEAIARLIPEVQERIDSGDSLSNLMSDDLSNQEQIASGNYETSRAFGSNGRSGFFANIFNRSQNINDALKGVEYKPIRTAFFSRSEEQIISNISGGDMTEGSCSSLALAYAGNRAGYIVYDFRDGQSREVFSSRSSIEQIANLDGVNSQVLRGTDDTICAERLMSSMEQGRQYYMATGAHAAIVRLNNEGIYQYLELQSGTLSENGWHTLTLSELYSRFGCEDGQSREYANYLIELESLQNNAEFLNLLGYINTDESAQMRGESGYVR